MKDFLILRLQGAMQAWGRPTLEEWRPTHNFPTRSGIVGIIGACLGIERNEVGLLYDLSHSFRFVARLDMRPFPMRKIVDFHTVKKPRLAPQSTRKLGIVTEREYLCDAQFSLALEFVAEARYSLEQVREAVQRPVYTPFLGRKSCPLGQPLYFGTIQAQDLLAALSLVEPDDGPIYSEVKFSQAREMVVRDIPTRHFRKFLPRTIYIK